MENNIITRIGTIIGDKDADDSCCGFEGWQVNRSAGQK